MAKKESNLKSFIRLPTLFLILALVVGGWWLWQPHIEWKDVVYQYVENGEITTLESKLTPTQIMDAHQQELLGSNNRRTYQDPIYKYYPHLLLDIKYTEDKKSREGVVLWSLIDGEMVLNTETWETTHGFKDCLDCEANRQDFKILQALAKRGGTLSLDELQKELHVERDLLESGIESARQKHLIVQKGTIVQLHFENPKLLVMPQTQIKQHVVSRPIQNTQRTPKVYSRSQIIAMAKAAFGSDFTIRSEQEIFLPVYTLGVLNPDGSVHTSDWNAITGQRMGPSRT
jgi:hypothetical protein